MTRNDFSKKKSCCGGFLAQRLAVYEPDQDQTDQFVTAATDYIGKASSRLAGAGLDAEIPVPVPENADNRQICLVYLGSALDAMGRMLGMDVPFPDDEFILALTNAEENILH